MLYGCPDPLCRAGLSASILFGGLDSQLQLGTKSLQYRGEEEYIWREI